MFSFPISRHLQVIAIVYCIYKFLLFGLFNLHANHSELHIKYGELNSKISPRRKNEWTRNYLNSNAILMLVCYTEVFTRSRVGADERLHTSVNEGLI